MFKIYQALTLIY